MSRRQRHQAKLMAVDSRRAFFTLAFGVVVVAGLVWIVVNVPAKILPEQLAVSIKAQRVHKVAVVSPGMGASHLIEPASTAFGTSTPHCFGTLAGNCRIK
jgi:hypothetical protein